MSQRTKRPALDKLAHLNVKIAYPDKRRDYSALQVRPDDLVGDVQAGLKFDWMRRVRRLNSPVDRDEWDMTPQTVNAYYDTNLNELVLPVGALQPLFFDPAADSAVNYGGIGATIGHEMTHGFDDEGRKYDGAGVLSTPTPISSTRAPPCSGGNSTPTSRFQASTLRASSHWVRTSPISAGHSLRSTRIVVPWATRPRP
jgi:hypothetical protein